MDASIDVEELYSEVNRCLSPEQQVQKDDPLFTAIVLNKVILGVHVRFVEKKLHEAVQQMTTATEQHSDRAAAIADRLITRAGNQIERQVDTAACHWEQRLRRASSDGEANIRRATWLAWTGAILIFISACAAVGSYMGNVALAIMHQSQPRHR